MKFPDFFAPPRITAKEIADFYRYSEISKWLGQTRGRGDRFGERIRIDCTRQNSMWMYDGVWLFGDKRWAHVSIRDEIVQIRYLETDYMPLAEDCPVVTDTKIVALVTKELLAWHKKIGLPRAILVSQKRMEGPMTDAAVKEVTIDVSGEKAVLRVLGNKRSFLVFNTFPPKKGKLTPSQYDDFAGLLSKATGKRVVRDDRELFIVYDDSQTMIDRLKSFLQSV